MKTILIALFLLPSLSLFAQLGGGTAPAPTVLPKPAAPAIQGIKLKDGWDKLLTRTSRAQNRDMIALRTIFTAYGEPKRDVDPHPECNVFPGIPYLTPLRNAEQTLNRTFGTFGMAAGGAVAMEGLPQGLRFRRYDKGSARIGDCTHLYIIVDEHDQVVSVGFKAVHARVPFTPDGYTYQSAGRIPRANLIEKLEKDSYACVADQRIDAKYLVVVSDNLLLPEVPFRFVPGLSPLPRGRDYKQIVGDITVTWFVPQPLANLILFCSKITD